MFRPAARNSAGAVRSEITVSSFEMTGSIATAVQYGLVPFIAGDLVKAAIAALGFPAVWALLGRR